MYVLGSDRSLSHELLIVRHHNSLRAPHPSLSLSSLFLPRFRDTLPHSYTLYTNRVKSIRVLFLYDRVRRCTLERE